MDARAITVEAGNPCLGVSLEPFRETLSKHGLGLERKETTTLQINLGLRCNQVCRHCHLEAGPEREELMPRAVQDQVVRLAAGGRFETIDVTGGAPELHPDLATLIARLAGAGKRLMVRSNLSALAQRTGELLDCFKRHRVVVVASLPSVNQAQTESQRGEGAYLRSVDMLRRLNAEGYGIDGSGLELDLVSNPTGAFMPPRQEEAEGRFRVFLKKHWGITFNRLFTFANVPVGRFRQWLEISGNLERYMDRLTAAFNPCAVEGLMCRSLLSVAWDGYLYDCDFNLARRLPLGGQRTHISEIHGPPMPGTPIAVADHCYTCTAGSGFT